MDWTLTLGSLSLGLYDLIALLLLLISSILCAFIGFSRSASKSFGIILAIPIALLFTSSLASLIASKSNMSIFFATLVAFVSLSVIVYILIYYIGVLLERSLEALHLSVLNSLLGFIWGALVSAVVISVISALITYQPFIDFTPLFENSILYKTLFKELYSSSVSAFKEAISAIK